GGVGGARAVGLVDDGDVVGAGGADAVGGQVEAGRVVDLDGFDLPGRAEGERLYAVPLRVDRIALAGVGRVLEDDGGGPQAPPVVEVHARGAVGRPPVQVIERPQRRGISVARPLDALEVVVGFGQPVAQAGRGHGGEIVLVQPGIRRVGSAG